MINLFRIHLFSMLLLNVYGFPGEDINITLWEYGDCAMPKAPADKNVKPLDDNDDMDDEHEADAQQITWMVILWHSNSTPAEVVCTGVLVNRYYVFSAEICQDFADMVRIGEIDPSSQVGCEKSGKCAPPPQDIKISRYISPNDHNSEDIIIELEEPVQYSDFVKPICLPDTLFQNVSTSANRASVPSEQLIVGWYGPNKLRNGVALFYTGARRIKMEKCKVHPNKNKREYCMELGIKSLASSRSGLPDRNLGAPVMVKKKVCGSYRKWDLNSILTGAQIAETGFNILNSVSDTVVSGFNANKEKLEGELKIQETKTSAAKEALNHAKTKTEKAKLKKELLKIEQENIVIQHKWVELKIKETQLKLVEKQLAKI